MLLGFFAIRKIYTLLYETVVFMKGGIKMITGCLLLIALVVVIIAIISVAIVAIPIVLDIAIGLAIPLIIVFVIKAIKDKKGGKCEWT